MTTNFATGGHLVVNGAGTLDIQGDNSGLINAMQIGTQNAAGPTIIAHDAGSLGSVINGQITMFFNSGAINNQKGGPITFASSLLSSIGGAGSFPSTYAGADMEFQGAINFFRPTGTTTESHYCEQQHHIQRRLDHDRRCRHADEQYWRRV